MSEQERPPGGGEHRGHRAHREGRGHSSHGEGSGSGDEHHRRRSRARGGGSGRGEEWEQGRESGPRERGRHRRRWGHRKERILHTRISQQLAEDIREMAEDLRMPVSNLVRNVLEEAFGVMEQVTEDVGDLLGEVVERAERAAHRMDRRRERPEAEEGEAPTATGEPPPPSLAEAFPGVIAWQLVVLNQPRRCARSGEDLAAGSRAYLGIPAGGGAPVVISEWAFHAGDSAA